MSLDRKALSASLRGAILRRSLMVALIIGTVLSAINHGDTFAAGTMPALWKLVLTYIVPFLVATYGAYSALQDRRRG